MATTSRITSIATKYGTSSYGTLGRVYAGEGYRTRITFPAVRSAAGIGDANIVVTKVLLHMRRDSDGPTTVYAGCSANSAWGAAVDASDDGYIPASTGWHVVELENCKNHILEYGGNWHLHLTGDSTQVRCNGAGSSYGPYISIVWEYAASTITTGTEKSVLGQPINFKITPRAGDAKFALSYIFGTESGNIAETSSTSISWTPPLEYASEIPNGEIGEMRITMKVYDASGSQIRTEILFVTVTVPETAVVKFQNGTFNLSALNALAYGSSTAALTGKTSLRITPVLDISGAYGASIASLRAEIDNAGSVQTIEWSTLTETNAGIFTGAALDSGVLQKAGSTKVTLTATDTRGREVTAVRTLTVYAYANPVITAFSVERYEPVYDSNEQVSDYAPSDIGENVWVTVKASCTNVVVSSASRNFLSWKITAKAADGSQTTYSGNSGTAQSVSIENSRTIITAVVPAANAVEYTLEVTDTAGYKAYQYYSVAPGRANFALAGSKYGASFGCMPRGTQANPMLESAYPIYAYGGIAYKDLIWENASPESEFTKQTIALDLSRYKQVEIIFKLPDANSFMPYNDTWFEIPMVFNVGSHRAATVPRIGGGSTGNAIAIFYWRYIRVLEDSIEFDYCWGMTGAGWAGMGRDDNCYVPLRIYGVKDAMEITTYASGNPVSFRAASGTAISPVTVLNPKQAGNGDPYPAGGGSKNKFTGWIVGEAIDSSNGAFVTNSTRARVDYIPVLPSSKMTVSGLQDTLLSFVAFYDANKAYISRTGGTAKTKESFSTPENCEYIAFMQYEHPSVTGQISDLKDTVQVEYGEVATEDEPYANIRPITVYDTLTLNHHGEDAANTLSTYTVQLGQTVCSGRMDWSSGKLVAEWACVQLDGTEGWAKSTVQYGEKTRYDAYRNITNGNAIANEVVCSHFPYNGVNENGAWVNPDTSPNYLNLRIQWDYSSADELIAYLASQAAAGTPVQIAYKLATPLEIQLTAQQILALAPTQTNTLYGDGDTIEVKYRSR